jgi:hypothetical protein
MIYVPDWETLSNGLARIIAATGATDDAARIALCHAISDKKIAVQAVVAKGQDWAGESVTGRQLGVPPRLTPAAFDWEKSQPLTPWELGRYPNDIDWGARNVALLEVSTRDVIATLAPGPNADKHPAPAGANSKLSKVAKTEKFKEWREARGNNVPTVREDVAYMKQFGVGRDEVRELSKGYPRLARGRPKENKIGG